MGQNNGHSISKETLRDFFTKLQVEAILPPTPVDFWFTFHTAILFQQAAVMELPTYARKGYAWINGGYFHEGSMRHHSSKGYSW